jgi:hypothetical protein
MLATRSRRVAWPWCFPASSSRRGAPPALIQTKTRQTGESSDASGEFSRFVCTTSHIVHECAGIAGRTPSDLDGYPTDRTLAGLADDLSQKRTRVHVQGPVLVVSFVTQRHCCRPSSTGQSAGRFGVARPQVPFLAATFSTAARLRVVFEGTVSATASEAGKVSSRASSSISSSVGGRFGVGCPTAASLRSATDFMAFSRVTRTQEQRLPGRTRCPNQRLASFFSSRRSAGVGELPIRKDRISIGRGVRFAHPSRLDQADCPYGITICGHLVKHEPMVRSCNRATANCRGGPCANLFEQQLRRC